MKHTWTFIGIFSALLIICFAASVIVSRASAPPEEAVEPETMQPIQEVKADGIFEARIQYEHDIDAPNRLFVEIKIYPHQEHAPFPGVVGGHSETNVHTWVHIRGLSVPNGLQSHEDRHVHHDDVEIERRRWNDAMTFLWQIISPNKKLRVVNPEIVDGKLYCDLKFYLGGTWHDVAIAMINDNHARKKEPGLRWKWGTRLLEVEPVE